MDSVPSELVNIASGQIASKPVEQYLTSIPEKGTDILNKFIAQRLVKGRENDFWDAVPKSAVAATFGSMKKALPFDKDKKLVLDPEVFHRLLCVARQRNQPEGGPVLRADPSPSSIVL